jgi:hypothetical protein
MTTNSNPEAGALIPFPAASDSTDERLAAGRAAGRVDGQAGPAGETLSARSPELDFRIAGHEAGHVITHLVLGYDVHSANIVQTATCSGRTTWGPHPRWTPLPDIAASSDTAALARHAGPGQQRDGDVRSLFSDVQSACITLMGGGAAEMCLIEDSPPRYMASDVPDANGIASMICSTTESVAAFLEHCYQEASAIIEENKSVVIALAQALIDHPDRTLNSDEINSVIAPALAAKAVADKNERRARWAGVENNAAQFCARSES